MGNEQEFLVSLSNKLKKFSSMGALNLWIHKPMPSDIKQQDPICYECMFYVEQACHILDCWLSYNYAQWDYWHCVNKSGGLFRFSLEYLIKKLDEFIAGVDKDQFRN